MLDSIEDDHLVGRELPTGDCVGNLVSMMVDCAHHLSFLIPHMQSKVALVQHVFHGLLRLDTYDGRLCTSLELPNPTYAI
jgi:hypothetical protein